MRERLSAAWNTVKERWASAGKKVHIIILAGGAGICVLALAIVMTLNHTDYIVLYNNLTVEENAAVLAMLQEMGVAGSLEGNSILIPKDSESTVRMQLAMRGYPESGFGYDIFAQGSGLTATQYDKNKYDIFQQQERLAAMIKTFPEVRDAHVTINIPDNNVFVLQSEIQKPSVSVKIEKMPGRQLSADQVRGILNLISTSVPNLDEENIAIVDEAGDLRYALDMTGDKNSLKLQLVEQVNATLARKIMEMLAPVYGDEKVVVKVNSVLDTNERTIDQTTYYPLDPENPTNNMVDYYETEYERGGAGTLAQGVPGANDNTDVPQYSAEIVDDGSGDYYRAHNVIDYLISSERNQITNAGFTITDTTVAVVIDAPTLPVGQRDQILDLVAKASGILPDKVSVQNIEFTRPTLPDEIIPPNWRNLIIAIIVGVLALIILLIIIFATMARKKKQAMEEGVPEEYEDVSLVDLINQQESFDPINIPETTEQKLKAQIKDLAESDPEIVAQLIKTWLMSA